jgi:hypothetical protein
MRGKSLLVLISTIVVMLLPLLAGCSGGGEEAEWSVMPPWFILFSVWSPIWWLVFVALQVSLLWVIANEDTGGRWGLSIVFCWFFVMEFFGNLGFFSWISESPFWHVLLVIGIYLLGGCIWGPVWWIFRCASRRHDYNDELLEFLKKRGYDKIPETLPSAIKKDWTAYLLDSSKWSRTKERYGGPRVVRIKPSAWEERFIIMKHMAWWPYSIAWSMFADVIRSVWRVIYSVYTNMLDWISNWSFKGTEGHFDQPEEEKKE